MNLESTISYIKDLCTTPSPTGYTKEAEKYLMDTFKEIGYEPYQNVKGNVIVPIKEGEENGLLLSAHIDTLGLMVRSVKAKGKPPWRLPPSLWRTRKCDCHHKRPKEIHRNL